MLAPYVGQNTEYRHVDLDITDGESNYDYLRPYVDQNTEYRHVDLDVTDGGSNYDYLRPYVTGSIEAILNEFG
jgi:hypothetical protein